MHHSHPTSNHRSAHRHPTPSIPLYFHCTHTHIKSIFTFDRFTWAMKYFFSVIQKINIPQPTCAARESIFITCIENDFSASFKKHRTQLLSTIWLYLWRCCMQKKFLQSQDKQSGDCIFISSGGESWWRSGLLFRLQTNTNEIQQIQT